MQTLDLDGTWKLRYSDGQRGRPEYATREQTDLRRYIDATVPGEVHLDAWRAGWIADPYVGVNCLAARWVEECIWSYRREVDVPEEALRGRAWLVFDRLDYFATVFLNGAEAGRHANFFYPCRIEVTGKLKAGRNILAVNLDSGLWGVSDKPAEGWAMFPDQRLHKRHWLRKPQCQFSWDWSTRLTNVGISGPVRLEWTEDPARLDQLVPLVEVSDDLKRGTARARLFVENLGSTPLQGELTVEVAGARATASVEIKPGLHPCEATVAVENPALWWPVGHGPQNLHALKATLRIGGRAIGQKSAQVGFRRVRINQDPHPQQGRYFTLEVNNRRIFAKGGNFVPADMIFAAIDRQRYDRLTDLALEQNYNFLRVWGGGLYEGEDFYDLCDRKGILVWQEFIFACARYPVSDEGFTREVRAEATWNVRRLASHPSLVVWCGNNEMEWGAWDWGYDRVGAILPDHGLFHVILPRLLQQEDPTRYYQPSSPFSPGTVHPNADHVGDQHPWQVGFANGDFRDYRKMTCRFPNEGGILGPTALPTMLACLPDGQRRLHSFAWDVHENSVDSWAEPSHPDNMVKLWLGRDPADMSIEEFTYRAGLVQGEGLREYVENFRRRMFDTASAIFWMYNDTWPATRSWTTVDYYLRRTPAFHPVRRAMAPLGVVVAQEGEQVVVFGVNDTPEPVQAELRHGLFAIAGGLPLDRTAPVTVAANASTRLASFPMSQWTDPAATIAFAMLMRQGEVLARGRLVLPLFKELKWSSAQVAVRVEGGRAIFTSPTFAWGVCLDLDGEQPLADNFFDVWPGMPYSIPWTAPTPPRVLRVGNL